MPSAPGRYAGLPPGHPAIPPGMVDSIPTAEVTDSTAIVDGVVTDLIDNVVDDRNAGDKPTTLTRTVRPGTRSKARQYPK